MQLELKTQQLKPRTHTNKEVLAIAVNIEPKNQDDKARRGVLFLTLELRSERNADLNTAATLFADTLKEEYYKQNNDTPLSAIEKATAKAKRNTTTLSGEDSGIQISFCTALIWNRVLYISHLGSPAAYLIRSSGVKDLAPHKSDNEVITLSGLLTENDVVIIGTTEFRKQFPPQEIVSNLGGLANTASSAKNTELIASILIKTMPTKQKKRQITKTVNADKITGLITSRLSILKNRVFKKDSLSDKYKPFQTKKPAPVASISATANTTAPIGSKVQSGAKKRKRITKHTSKKSKSITIGILFVAIITTIAIIPKRQTELVKTEMTPILSLNNKAERSESILGVKTDTDYLIELKDIDSNFSPVAGDIYQKGQLVFLDIDNSSIYTLDTNTKESKKINDTLINPKLIDCDATYCFVTEGELIKGFEVSKPEETNTYTLELNNIQDIAGQNQNVYILTSRNIYVLKLGDKNSKPKKWLDEKESLIAPTSMATAKNSLYVLDGRHVYRYMSMNGSVGVKRDFSLDTSYLLSPSQLRVNNDHLFVLNVDDKEVSVVIFNLADGLFVKKVKLSTKESVPDIRFIIPETEGLDFYYIKDGLLYKSTE